MRALRSVIVNCVAVPATIEVTYEDNSRIVHELASGKILLVEAPRSARGSAGP